MEKFLTSKFVILLLLALILLIVHELGLYLAYRLLGFEARMRRSNACFLVVIILIEAAWEAQ